MKDKSKVVLEGCNGEWSQKCYLPFLMNKAAKGNIELQAIDIKPKIKLSTPFIADSWQVAQGKDKTRYLDKIRNKESYERLSSIDYVFVVAPDQYHCEIAEFWLERLSQKGKIFIEKPLDASLESATKLGEKVGKGNLVYGFDHYPATAYPFLQNKATYLKKIGKIREIEFRILEPPPIPQNRAETLAKGMIFDLFCHALALVGAIAGRNPTPSPGIIKKLEVREVKAAQYENCPIAGETLAELKLVVNNNIEVISIVGKGVGKDEDKSMVIHGSEGRLEFDFVKYNFFIFNPHGERQDEGRLEPRHVESFLEAILLGKDPILAPGVLSFNAAFEILKVLDRAKQQIGKMTSYPIGESVDEILGRFK